MSRPKFDNLNDVTAKFVNTTCLYKDEPVYVKTAFHDDDDPNEFRLSVTTFAGPGQIIDLHSPDFRYHGYNLGYANSHGVATYWYRRPAKQYQQGLKPEQLKWYSDTGLAAPKTMFQFNRNYVSMLKNSYPTLDLVKDMVRGDTTHSQAWHRDFSIYYDHDSKHYILNYRGHRVGTFNSKPTYMDLTPTARHLKEALHEALG